MSVDKGRAMFHGTHGAHVTDTDEPTFTPGDIGRLRFHAARGGQTARDMLAALKAPPAADDPAGGDAGTNV